MKKSLWFVLGAVTAGILLITVALFVSPVSTVLASSISGNRSFGPPWAQMWQQGGWPGNGAGFRLPPELQGLTSIPANQRFSHFIGAQINLKDQNNQPLTINVIPGKVTASSGTGLTIAANSGTSQTFTLNSQTIIHAGQAATSTPTGTSSASTNLKNGDAVIVVALNNSNTATAVMDGGSDGFASPGHPGWWNHNRINQ